jgi:hypothetical protein
MFDDHREESPAMETLRMSGPAHLHKQALPHQFRTRNDPAGECNECDQIRTKSRQNQRSQSPLTDSSHSLDVLSERTVERSHA